MKKPKPFIALELGQSELRAAEVVYRRGRPIINSCGRLIMDRPLFREEIRPDYLSGRISELTGLAGMKSDSVIAGVSGSEIIYRRGTFPRLEGEKQRSLIRLQAGEFIPVPPDSLVLDYLEIGPGGTDDRSVDVLLAAAPLETMEGIAEAIAMAGYDIIDITPTPLSVAAYLAGQEFPHVRACIYISGQAVSIFFVSSGRVVYARAFTAGEDSAGHISEDILYEMDRTLKYYSSRLEKRYGPVAAIVTAGGAENQTGEHHKLSARFGIYAEPLPSIDIPQRIPEMSGAEYNGCLSLISSMFDQSTKNGILVSKNKAAET